jgi:cytochrome P450
MSEVPVRDGFIQLATRGDHMEVLRVARRETPVFLTHDAKGREMYVVTTYALVKAAFGDAARFSNDYGKLAREGTANPEADAILAQGPFEYHKIASLLLHAEGSAHQRLRALANPLFSPRVVAALSAKLDSIANELVDEFVARGECDLKQDFAIPLPLRVILGICGFDQDMRQRVQAWSNAAMIRMSHTGTAEQEVAAAHQLNEMNRFLQAEVLRRRESVRADALSQTMQARVDGYEPLSDLETVALLAEVLVAGNETSRNALVAGLVLLLQNPEQLAAVRADAALMGNAMEEILRFHTPAAAIWRLARTDVVLDGINIPAGSILMLRLDSANRDEAQFAKPDELNIRRTNARHHVSFGFGVHHCIGQFLARRELISGLTCLLARLPDLRILDAKSDLTRLPHIIHHAHKRVHVLFTPGSAVTGATVELAG